MTGFFGKTIMRRCLLQQQQHPYFARNKTNRTESCFLFDDKLQSMATKGRGVELSASASTLSKINRSLSRRIPYNKLQR